MLAHILIILHLSRCYKSLGRLYYNYRFFVISALLSGFFLPVYTFFTLFRWHAAFIGSVHSMRMGFGIWLTVLYILIRRNQVVSLRLLWLVCVMPWVWAITISSPLKLRCVPPNLLLDYPVICRGFRSNWFWWSWEILEGRSRSHGLQWTWLAVLLLG